MNTVLYLDKIDTLSIVAVDPVGNAGLPVVFDSPPVWTNSNPSAATNVVSKDGKTNVLTPVAAGQTTTIGVTAIVGGVKYTASMDYAVASNAIASISIADAFSPKP